MTDGVTRVAPLNLLTPISFFYFPYSLGAGHLRSNTR